MLTADKTAIQPQVQIVVDAKAIDFNSKVIKDKIEKVHQEVKAVLDGAIIDSAKLSLSFTV